MKRRVLFVVQAYPQVSETYIKNEIEVLADTCDIEIVALSAGDYPYRVRQPHITLTQQNQRNVLEYLRGFAPNVIHVHYFHLAQTAAQLAAQLKIPYTVRNHSFDVLGASADTLRTVASLVNRDECLGMLTFPFTCDMLERAGIRSEKLQPCFPVIRHTLFLDAAPNGMAVMNVGAAIPKKNMADFIALSRLVPDREFNLYAMGYEVDQLRVANARGGGRVNFMAPVAPDDMPLHYKRHEWLVYTASREYNTVGWPLAIAEAQASGTGVCMQNVRPDLAEYVGNAGFLFDTPEEAAAIVSQSFPDDMRQRGFELSRRCAIEDHIGLLTDLWDRAAR